MNGETFIASGAGEITLWCRVTGLEGFFGSCDGAQMVMFQVGGSGE